jgi:hypothetical protein
MAGFTVTCTEDGPVAVLHVGVMDAGLRTSVVLLLSAVVNVNGASAVPPARKLKDGAAPFVTPAQLLAVDTE